MPVRRRSAQPFEEDLGRGAPGIALPDQPGAHRLLVEPGGLGGERVELGVEGGRSVGSGVKRVSTF